MRQCKCGNKIPNYLKIEGKGRNLSKRKRCLVCSPWGLRSRIPEDAKIKGDNFICLSCKREFPLDRSKGHRSRKCASCNILSRKSKMKLRCLEYKGNSCIRCRYNKCSAALVFHHFDESNKEFNISGSYNRSWNKLKAELDKCILICSNCHAELHYGGLG